MLHGLFSCMIIDQQYYQRNTPASSTAEKQALMYKKFWCYFSSMNV